MALLGRNHYEEELNELRDTVTGNNKYIADMNELYCKSVEAYDSVSRKVTELEALIADGKKRESSLQQLVENQRRRISDYQQRIQEYNNELNRLLQQDQNK